MKCRAKGKGTISQNPKGLWVAQISLPNGRRKAKYSKTQKVVKDWLLAQRQAVQINNWVEEEKITFSAIMDRNFAVVATHTLRPKTLESYECLICLHIKPDLGEIKLSALRPDHLQSLYSQKLNSGLSRRTVQYIHSILHKALEQALKWGLVSRNVADLVDALFVKRQAPITFWFLHHSKTAGIGLNSDWISNFDFDAEDGFDL